MEQLCFGMLTFCRVVFALPRRQLPSSPLTGRQACSIGRVGTGEGVAWCRAAAQMSCRLRYCFGMFFEHCCLGFRVYWVGGCQNSFVSAVFGVLLESGSAVREHVSVDFQPQVSKKGVFSSSDIGAVNAGLRLEIRSPTCYIPPGCNFSESPGCVRSHPCACLFAASESSVVRYTSMKYRGGYSCVEGVRGDGTGEAEERWRIRER